MRVGRLGRAVPGSSLRLPSHLQASPDVPISLDVDGLRWCHGPADDNDVYTPNATDIRSTSFDPTCFAAFPTSVGRDPTAFASGATAPWLKKGNLLPEVPVDRTGKARTAPVDLGPFER